MLSPAFSLGGGAFFFPALLSFLGDFNDFG